MASRFDQPSEPDLDRYETRDDVDLPEGFGDPDAPIDPAEQAAHTLAEALLGLERELGKKLDLDRAHVLKQLTRQAFNAVDRVDAMASRKIDALVERLR